MKLYAWIASERAKKGQGGNKYLDIDIDIEHPDKTRETLAKLAVTQSPYHFLLSIIDKNGGIETIKRIDKKGKKQKGEKCFNCGEYQAEKTSEGDFKCYACGIYSKNNKKTY
jgi:hypothetical protein